ncbi:hypothetical protein V7S43_001597 [Phytophthora oleae]|uniref:RxLR effector protein n=1 Tax=Phytophthora oleae TaxID=2107226 RepID=A0ABD3G7C3_9STRA
MRISHFLFVASAALLSSCNVTAAISSEGEAKLSMAISTHVQVPSSAIDTSNGKRFLRSYYKEDEAEEDEEERGVMTPSQVAKWTDRAEYWVLRKHTPSSIKDKLTDLNGILIAKNEKKYQLFFECLEQAEPSWPRLAYRGPAMIEVTNFFLA